MPKKVKKKIFQSTLQKNTSFCELDGLELSIMTYLL